jgi:ADP-heptose:LPS heptosyltransferase
LIGDGLCISPALRAWYKEHEGWEVNLLTLDDHIADIYNHMGVPLTVCFQPLHKEYDFEHVFDISKAFQICDQQQCQMADGYARDMGITLEPTAQGIHTYYDPGHFAEDDPLVESVPRGTILFAPFSMSCTVHDPRIRIPNKTLPWPKWKPIIKFLRTLGLPIRVTGRDTDRCDQLGFSEEEYLCGFPLRPLVRVMKEKASMLVSVDNGISHLAGSQDLPQVLMYPMCLGLHYAVPWGNPFVMPIHMNPAEAEPVQLLWSLKMALNAIEKVKRGESLAPTEENS